MLHNKPQMKPRRFGKVLPVRLTDDTNRRLKRIADHAGLTKSDALRMAINHGLPNLEAGHLKLQEEAA